MPDKRNNTENLIMGYSTLIKNICNLIEYPNIDNYNEEELTHFLDNNNFSEDEKKLIQNSSHKNQTYNMILAKRDHQNSYLMFSMFNNYFENNKNFLTPEVREEIENMSDNVWHNWVTKTFNTPS